MKWINKTKKFMQGRYGIDELSNLLFCLYTITIILDIFLSSIWLSLTEIILVIIILYRLFSKNIYQRNEENRKYLEIKKELIKPFNIIIKNINDNSHIYKKCPKCKTTLKLPIPYKRGFKHTRCPICHHRLTFLVLKQEKIEIIKN